MALVRLLNGPVTGVAAGAQAVGAQAIGVQAAGGGAASGSAAGRIVLVVVAVVAVGAFTVLQLMARSRRRRSPAEPEGPDRTTFPRRWDQESRDGGWAGDEPEPGDGDDDAMFGLYPNWGYWSPPGYRGSPQPPLDARQPGSMLPPR
jgi:hypothetical protein